MGALTSSSFPLETGERGVPLWALLGLVILKNRGQHQEEPACMQRGFRPLSLICAIHVALHHALCKGGGEITSTKSELTIIRISLPDAKVNAGIKTACGGVY